MSNLSRAPRSGEPEVPAQALAFVVCVILGGVVGAFVQAMTGFVWASTIGALLGMVAGLFWALVIVTRESERYLNIIHFLGEIASMISRYQNRF